MDGIENLRTFVAVADAQSLSGAARHLGIAASVATKRIDQLERKVRTRLFTRSTRRVRLTEFGARYLSPARRLIHDYDEVLAGMSRSLQQIEGNLRIKVPTPLAVGHMAEVLAKFQQQFPLLSLDIVLAERAVNPLEEGFDIAIHGLPDSFPGVIDEPLFPLHRLVCASPAYLERRPAPKHPRELSCVLARWHDVDLRERERTGQHRVAAKVKCKRFACINSRCDTGKRHRAVAFVCNCAGAPLRISRASARAIHGTEYLDQGPCTRESCRHSTRSISAHVLEGTLFPCAPVGQEHLKASRSP